VLDLVQIGMSKINTYPDEAGVVLSNLEETVAYSGRVATELAEVRGLQVDRNKRRE
jgi:hypothetical protein